MNISEHFETINTMGYNMCSTSFIQCLRYEPENNVNTNKDNNKGMHVFNSEIKRPWHNLASALMNM